MNKDYDPDALRASLVMVGIDYAAPSPTNPRKTFNEAEMAELTDSIKKHGVLQPIIVRQWPLAYPSPGPLVTYEIIAGERRWRAAKAAGLPMLEAKLRELSDLEVLEIQIIENLQRADLHPLEEAEGYERIMATHAYTIEQLAEKIGKSRSYIFARLKLLALDDDARRLFRGGLLNPSTALLVARIPSAKLRVKAIEDITTPRYGNEPMSVRQAQERIRNRYMTKLTEAPFNRADVTLVPDAGSCLDCPNRTGNAPDLFDDIDNPDVCTDPDCFVAKKIAHRDREADKAQSAGAKVILGDEAKKIAPYGADSVSMKGYTKLSDKCYEDPEHRTYAEILGESAEATLLEDTTKNTLVPVLPNKIIAEKLQEAGVKLRDTERAKADEKVKAKLDLERAIRQRMFAMVRENVARMVDDDGAGMSFYAQDRIFNHIAIRMWERFGHDTRPLIANLWGAVGKTNTDRAEAFGLGIPTLSTADCWKLMVDMLLVTSTTVASEWDLERGGAQLATIADLFDIDHGEVKKLVQAEQKEQKPAAKGKKTAKTASTATEKNAIYPSKAAQAAGLTGEETPPAPPEAARASDSTPEEKALSSASDEANEKPSAADPVFAMGARIRIRDDAVNEDGVALSSRGQEGLIVGAWHEGGYVVAIGNGQEVFDREHFDLVTHQPLVLGIGDRVRFKEGLKGPAGNRRKCCGREGIIDEALYDGRVVVETDNGPVNAVIDELILIEKAIETDETPAKASRPAPQYQHPENSELVWTGRGRRPKWVESWLANGKPLDDLRTTPEQQQSSAPAGANATPSMAEAAERCTKTLSLPL